MITPSDKWWMRRCERVHSATNADVADLGSSRARQGMRGGARAAYALTLFAQRVTIEGMKRALKWIAIGLAVVGALVGAVVALLSFSFERDQAQFAAAANRCERMCNQDSGGLAGCREDCKGHPDLYGPEVQAAQQKK